MGCVGHSDAWVRGISDACVRGMSTDLNLTKNKSRKSLAEEPNQREQKGESKRGIFNPNSLHLRQFSCRFVLEIEAR
jgi:hypothetical protein